MTTFDWSQDPSRAAHHTARLMNFRQAPGRRADYRVWVGTRDQLTRTVTAAATPFEDGAWNWPDDPAHELRWTSSDSPLDVVREVSEAHPGTLVLLWDSALFSWPGEVFNSPGNPHHLLATFGTDPVDSIKLRLELLAAWYSAQAQA